jgi:hypothetical protein
LKTSPARHASRPTRRPKWPARCRKSTGHRNRLRPARKRRRRRLANWRAGDGTEGFGRRLQGVLSFGARSTEVGEPVPPMNAPTGLRYRPADLGQERDRPCAGAWRPGTATVHGERCRGSRRSDANPLQSDPSAPGAGCSDDRRTRRRHAVQPKRWKSLLEAIEKQELPASEASVDVLRNARWRRSAITLTI